MATPSFEFLRFLTMAKAIGLPPAFYESLDDQFTSTNPDKHTLANLNALTGRGRNGGRKSATLLVLDVLASENKKFRECQTLWEKPLVDIHHQLLSTVTPSQCRAFDISPWLERHGGKASAYYDAVMAYLVCHAVMFEYYTNKSETDFLDKIVMPAIQRTKDRFGHAPLIVELVPPELHDDIKYRCYPPEIMTAIEWPMEWKHSGGHNHRSRAKAGELARLEE